MLIESAQLLSTAHRVLDGTERKLEVKLTVGADGSGQMEMHRVKSQPRKLSGEWTLQESKPEITLSEDAVMAFTLALAKSIDTSTPIPKNSPGRKEANDMAERQNGK